jgi:hypothetical protein
VHHLDRLFSVRYGRGIGDNNWQFPDDDAGLEDLKILADHFCHHPYALSRMISRYAPWADVDSILAGVSGRRYTADTLGKLVNLTGLEWRQYGIRTMHPIDMTKEEREDYLRIRKNGQKLKRRRLKGEVKVSRAEYEGNSLSKTQPWVAEGISKTTWYERRKKTRTSVVLVKLVSEGTDLSGPERYLCQEIVVVPSAPLGSQTLAYPSGARSTTSPHAEADLCQTAEDLCWSNHPMSALRVWSPAPQQIRKAA